MGASLSSALNMSRPAECDIYLLAVDGVYLPTLPRLLKSSSKTSSSDVNGEEVSNLVLTPGSRWVSVQLETSLQLHAGSFCIGAHS